MGFMDKMKEAAANAQVRNKEHHISLTITSGKNELGLGMFSSGVVMRENADGLVYFDTLPDRFFALKGFEWDGPMYKDVVIENTKDKSKTKTKHKGGLGGAVVGTLLMPGIGTAIGYAATRKKVDNTKGNIQTVSNSSQEEVMSPATIELADVDTGSKIVFGFDCNTQISNELRNFNWSKKETSTVEVMQDVSNQQDKVTLLKQYKELLDSEIITQEEFEQKKKELLGL